MASAIYCKSIAHLLARFDVLARARVRSAPARQTIPRLRGLIICCRWQRINHTINFAAVSPRAVPVWRRHARPYTYIYTYICILYMYTRAVLRTRDHRIATGIGGESYSNLPGDVFRVRAYVVIVYYTSGHAREGRGLKRIRLITVIRKRARSSVVRILLAERDVPWWKYR